VAYDLIIGKKPTIVHVPLSI